MLNHNTSYTSESNTTSSYSETHEYSSNGVNTSSRFSSNSQSQNSTRTTLTINVVSASGLASAQRIGAQDPYVQFSLNSKEGYQKTEAAKNAGSEASWNQTFNLPLNGESDLFVEVRNKNTTVDDVIGFAAIPIAQVVNNDGAQLNGLFDLYDTKGERAGSVNLKLSAAGYPNSRSGAVVAQPVRAKSYAHEDLSKRASSTGKKSTGVAVGGALLGGALAVGAGLLGKKLYDDRKNKQEGEQSDSDSDSEEAQKQSQRADESQQQESQQQESQQQESRKESRDEERNSGSRRGNGRRGSQSGSDDDSGSDDERRSKGKKGDKHGNKDDCGCDGKKGAKEWNPVGTYAAGDRVKYHGQTYLCLQGHTSNPTWQPGAAHSLWQAE